MPNPLPAFPNTFCDNCEELIPEDDNVYFCDDGKFCQQCAGENNNVCECGNYKKEEFETCYECSQS